MKNTIFVCLFLFSVIVCEAQNDSQLSHYSLAPSLFNPGAVGGSIDERADALILQRSQFMGFKGAPVTWFAGVGVPFEIGTTRHGAGLILRSEKIGYFDKADIGLNYAYSYTLAGGSLRFGVSLGVLSYQLDPPSDWASLNDESIPSRKEASSMSFDLGLGVFYRRSDFFSGISVTHLNQPRLLKSESGGTTLRTSPVFYVTGGYMWHTPIENIDIEPSGMMMFTSMRKPQLTLVANMIFKEQYWLGMSYRYFDAAGLMAGMHLGDAIRLGVSYEYPLSNLFGTNGGNLEFFVSYLFDVKFKRKEKKYKSVRFL